MEKSTKTSHNEYVRSVATKFSTAVFGTDEDIEKMPILEDELLRTLDNKAIMAVAGPKTMAENKKTPENKTPNPTGPDNFEAKEISLIQDPELKKNVSALINKFAVKLEKEAREAKDAHTKLKNDKNKLEMLESGRRLANFKEDPYGWVHLKLIISRGDTKEDKEDLELMDRALAAKRDAERKVKNTNTKKTSSVDQKTNTDYAAEKATLQEEIIKLEDSVTSLRAKAENLRDLASNFRVLGNREPSSEVTNLSPFIHNSYSGDKVISLEALIGDKTSESNPDATQDDKKPLDDVIAHNEGVSNKLFSSEVEVIEKELAATEHTIGNWVVRTNEKGAFKEAGIYKNLGDIDSWQKELDPETIKVIKKDLKSNYKKLERKREILGSNLSKNIQELASTYSNFKEIEKNLNDKIPAKNDRGDTSLLSSGGLSEYLVSLNAKQMNAVTKVIENEISKQV